MDIHDARFADVYTGGDFAIDPYSKAFAKGLITGMEALLKETRRRKQGEEGQSKAGRTAKRRKQCRSIIKHVCTQSTLQVLPDLGSILKN